MDSKLKKLFDYQRFANNPHLNEVIKNAQLDGTTELCDDQLFAVTGGSEQAKADEEKNKEIKQ